MYNVMVTINYCIDVVRDIRDESERKRERILERYRITFIHVNKKITSCYITLTTSHK